MCRGPQRGPVDRACKQFDSHNRYFLSTYDVPGPVLDPGCADGRASAFVEFMGLQEIKSVSKQAMNA